jgi:hypothetical protein
MQYRQLQYTSDHENSPFHFSLSGLKSIITSSKRNNKQDSLRLDSGSLGDIKLAIAQPRRGTMETIWSGRKFLFRSRLLFNKDTFRAWRREHAQSLSVGLLLCLAFLLFLISFLVKKKQVIEFNTSSLVAKPISSKPAASVLNSGTLRVHPTNPRYFTNASGIPLLLTGSHTWRSLQEIDTTNPVQTHFDYNAYLNLLSDNQHNFIRLWLVEESYAAPTYWMDPSPYERTGPGILSFDGKAKFNLTRYNQAFFDRLRTRVIAAGEKGIYVSIMLFDGWSIESKDGSRNPWVGHPYNKANNINNINGDPNNDGKGKEIHTLQISAVTALQVAYVKKVIDTVNDLDNVLYEISNESNPESLAWQNYLVLQIKDYEKGKAKQHPVGMTVPFPGGSNTDLFNSQADWISPNGDINNPIIGDGRKVIFNDTDHLCGVCGTRQFVWKSLTRGLNPIFMDEYQWFDQSMNPAVYTDVRKNMGYARTYALRMHLEDMLPHADLASSQYALANPSAANAEYLVYLPSGTSVTLDLSAASGQLTVEWFDPQQGQVLTGGTTTGGTRQTFIVPASATFFKGGDAVLYIYQDLRDKIYLPSIRTSVRSSSHTPGPPALDWE